MSERQGEISTLSGLLPGGRKRRLAAHQAMVTQHRTDTLNAYFNNAVYCQDPERTIPRIAQPYYVDDRFPVLNAVVPSPEALMFLDELAEARIALGPLATPQAIVFRDEYPRILPLLYGDSVCLRQTVEHYRDGEAGGMNGYCTAVQEVPDAQGNHAILLLPSLDHMRAL